MRTFAVATAVALLLAGCGDPEGPGAVPAEPTGGSEPAGVVWAEWPTSPPPIVLATEGGPMEFPPIAYCWTSPPRSDGLQESECASGMVPDDPPVVTPHDGTVEFRFDLVDWDFTATWHGSADDSEIEVTSIEPGVWEITVPPDRHGTIVLSGRGDISGRGDPGDIHTAFAVRDSGPTTTCATALDEIVRLTRDGMPTYDYDPALDLADLVARSDAVITGDLTGIERVAGTASNPIWMVFQLGDVDHLGGTADVADIISVELGGAVVEPLPGQPGVDGVRLVAFLHVWSDAPGSVIAGVQGLVLGCEEGPAIPVIEPLPDDAAGLTIDELVAVVGGLDGGGTGRVWTRDGSAVPDEIVREFVGATHCDWESATILMTGDPLGSWIASTDDAVTYVRDPDNVFGAAAGLDLEATLPIGAVDTGYASEQYALWVDPDDANAVYLVGEESVERWPRTDVPGCD